MSADLFAAFDCNTTLDQQQTQAVGTCPHPRPTPATATDPFATVTSLPQSKVALQPVQRQTSQPHAQPHSQLRDAGLASPFDWLATPRGQQHGGDMWGRSSAGLGLSLKAEPDTTVEADRDDDDAWGDFESAPARTDAAAGLRIHPQRANRAAPATNSGSSPRTRLVRADTMELMTNSLVDLGPLKSPLEMWQELSSSEQSPPIRETPPRKKRSSDPNVLFDADDFCGEDVEAEGDDFGEFEDAATAGSKPESARPSMDLTLLDVDLPAPLSTPVKRKPAPAGLSLSNMTISDEYPQAPKSPYGNFQTRKPTPVKGLRVTTPTPHATEFPTAVRDNSNSPTPITAWPTVGPKSPEPEWGEFKDLPTPAAMQQPKPTAAKSASAQQQASVGGWQAWDHDLAGPRSPEMGGLPPTNVPPPSVLLSVFPHVFDSANESLLKPLRGQPAGVRESVLSDAATTRFLRGYLGLATVAARIIAGRRLRWHRDRFLAQGMAISAAGGKRGMKLSAVDKSQAARDDGEAADLVAMWTQHVGPLRAAVAAGNAVMAKGDGGTPLRIPELSQSPSVQTAKMVVTAPKPCVICGLKRDERVAKVDVDVEDSFGEWWIDHFGHRTCRNFWAEFEVKLRQR